MRLQARAHPCTCRCTCTHTHGRRHTHTIICATLKIALTGEQDGCSAALWHARHSGVAAGLSAGQQRPQLERRADGVSYQLYACAQCVHVPTLRPPDTVSDQLRVHVCLHVCTVCACAHCACVPACRQAVGLRSVTRGGAAVLLGSLSSPAPAASICSGGASLECVLAQPCHSRACMLVNSLHA